MQELNPKYTDSEKFFVSPKICTNFNPFANENKSVDIIITLKNLVFFKKS